MAPGRWRRASGGCSTTRGISASLQSGVRDRTEHTLPFAALRHPETQRFLIEDYTLSLAPSAGALRTMPSPPAAPGGRLLVLGDPAPLPAGLEDLQGPRAEAAAVGRLLGVEPALGEQASESGVRAASSAAHLERDLPVDRIRGSRLT